MLHWVTCKCENTCHTVGSQRAGIVPYDFLWGHNMKQIRIRWGLIALWTLKVNVWVCHRHKTGLLQLKRSFTLHIDNIVLYELWMLFILWLCMRLYSFLNSHILKWCFICMIFSGFNNIWLLYIPPMNIQFSEMRNRNTKCWSWQGIPCLTDNDRCSCKFI